jgi:CRP/FNR family transcriptional regulator
MTALYRASGSAPAVIDRTSLKRLLVAYPGLRELEGPLGRRLATECTFFRVPDRAILFEEEDFCTAYPLIVSGSARVVRAGVTGREIVLYHVGAGEHCLLSALGLLAGWQHSARAVAEGRTSGAVIPGHLFRDVMRSDARFSTDVFAAAACRVDVLVRLIEQISILNIDQRLALLILSRGREIHATHQDLADELGCARENVSRALGRFHRKGIVVLGRGRVEVLDEAPLRSIAAAGRLISEARTTP